MRCKKLQQSCELMHQASLQKGLEQVTITMERSRNLSAAYTTMLCDHAESTPGEVCFTSALLGTTHLARGTNGDK